MKLQNIAGEPQDFIPSYKKELVTVTLRPIRTTRKIWFSENANTQSISRGSTVKVQDLMFTK